LKSASQFCHLLTSAPDLKLPGQTASAWCLYGWERWCAPDQKSFSKKKIDHLQQQVTVSGQNYLLYRKGGFRNRNSHPRQKKKVIWSPDMYSQK